MTLGLTLFFLVMARPLRIELAGVVYHVTARGDGREAIYLNDADREVWLEGYLPKSVNGLIGCAMPGVK